MRSGAERSTQKRARGICRLETLELDVTSEESVARAMATIRKNAGAVDVLVNNAGIAIAAVMEEVSLEDLRETI